MRRSGAILIGGLLVTALGPAVSAAEPGPEPLDTGSRIELPQDGFAVTFPDGWVVLDRSEFVPLLELGLAGLASETSEVLTPFLETLSVDDSVKVGAIIADLEVGTRGENCIVYTYPSQGRSVEAIVAAENDAYVQWAEEQLGLTVGGLEIDYLELDAGRTARMGLGPELTGLFGGSTGTDYVWADETTQYALSCTSTDPPDDRWLSVAETFELLPAD